MTPTETPETTPSVIPPEAPTRQERGIELFRRGAVSEHGDLFVVQGEARAYTVSLSQGEARCDCPDHRHRGVTCKHGYTVLIFAAKKRCGTRRVRRHPREPRLNPQQRAQVLSGLARMG